MYIDTLRLAKQIFPELNRFKLGKIAEYLGIEVIVAHRALDDVKTLIHVFNEMLKRIEKENISTWKEFAHRALDDVKTLIKVFEDMIKRISAKGIIKWNEFDEKWADNKDAYKKYPTANATILVTKQIGIKNLYKLISYSHVNHYYMKPRILKSIYKENSEGLIIGSRK